jgi:nucleotide-binding universal stress UspA family protein
MPPYELEIGRILAAIDFSERSTSVLARALDLAASFDARLTALHVLPPAVCPIPADPGLPCVPLPAGAGVSARVAAADALESLVRPFRRGGVPIDTMLREGDAAREIRAATETLPADLVVMGTHGKSGLERLLVGSVTEKTLRWIRVPVLGVGAAGEGTFRSGFRRILCALDLAGASRHTFDVALALAERSAAALTVVHVVEGLRGEVAGARERLGAAVPRRRPRTVPDRRAGRGRHRLAEDPPPRGGEPRRADRDGGVRQQPDRAAVLRLHRRERAAAGGVSGAGGPRSEGGHASATGPSRGSGPHGAYGGRGRRRLSTRPRGRNGR